MPLASTSRGQISYIAEATFGVTPGAGNPRDLRVTGETLDFAISKEMSNEINAARAVSSVVPVGAAASGGLQGELSYQEWDALMAAALQSIFAPFGTNGVGTTFTGDFTATTITASVAPTGQNAFTNLKRGQWFRLTTGAINNGRNFRVSKTVAPTATVITLDPGTPATVGSAVATCAISSSRLTNGVVQTSYTIERKSLDISQFAGYRGMTPSKMTLAVQSSALSNISFDFMGKDQAPLAAVTTLPGASIASYSYDIHSGVSGTDCQVWVNGAPLTGTFVKSLTLDYDNALRSQEAICTTGAVGIASGQIVCSITAQIYFADAAIYNLFLSNAYPEVSFSSLDPVGNGYFFTAPRANISTVKTNMGAKDQDMMLDVTFMCVRDAGNADATLRQVLFIDRVGVAAT